MAGRKGSVASRKKSPLADLDYHEGLSVNQVKVVLREFGLSDRSNRFFEWLHGQTCPFVKRYNKKGEAVDAIGVYEWDLFRWIENQKKGTPLIWD